MRTVDEILRDHRPTVARRNMLDIKRKAIADEIIDESGFGDGERVQTSGVGDGTASKVLKIVKATEELDREIKKLDLRIRLVENALSTLTTAERGLFELMYYEGLNYIQIEVKTGIPTSTCRKQMKALRDKMEPFLHDVLL